MVDQETAILQTQQWLQRLVIDENLCPFAKKPFADGLIRFAVSAARSGEALLSDLHKELTHLDTLEEAQLETTLLIVPNMLDDFLDYNDFLGIADALLVKFNWLGTYQIASFHPRYQFADTEEHACENYTNRAPWPTLHILREDSLDAALDIYPDSQRIFQRNIDTMNRLGEKALIELMREIKQLKHQGAEGLSE